MSEANAPGDPGRIAVVICSHQRVADLCRCLASILSSAGRDSLSVIVCLNEPDPAEFRRIADAGAASDPGACFIHVPTLGVSFARNAGIEAASAFDWTVFLDDDTTVPSNWIQALRASLGRTPAEVGLVTGRVMPKWEKTVIHSRKWRELLSLVEGTEPMTGGTEVPGVGAFFSVRSRLALTVGGFDCKMGRTGHNLFSGEEMLLFARVAQHGALLRYDPSAEVNHHIPEYRCTRAWMRNRAFWEGVTQRRLGIETGSSGRSNAAMSWIKSAAAGACYLVTQKTDLLVSTMWHWGFARADALMRPKA